VQNIQQILKETTGNVLEVQKQCPEKEQSAQIKHSNSSDR
jgi:hypothetical protein